MEYNTVGTATYGTEHGRYAKADKKTQKSCEPWIFHILPIIHVPYIGSMKFFNHLQLLPFLIGLFFGMFFVYVLKPSPTVIYKYPTMDNAGKVVYQDRNGVCFKYHADTVDCDKNEQRIVAYPLQ